MSEDTKLFGFVVRKAEDGLCLIAVTGDNPWYVSGFKNEKRAHEWIMEYLLSMNDNHQRLASEVAERAIDRNDRLKLLQAEMLAHVVTSKGKGN